MRLIRAELPPDLRERVDAALRVPPPRGATAPRPPRSPPRQLETRLHADFVRACRPLLRPDARLLRTAGEVPGGHGDRDPERVKAAMKRAGQKSLWLGYLPGTPDYLLLRPGHLLWLEFKVPGNALSDTQRGFRAWALACGHGHAVPTSVLGGIEAARTNGMLR